MFRILMVSVNQKVIDAKCVVLVVLGLSAPPLSHSQDQANSLPGLIESVLQTHPSIRAQKAAGRGSEEAVKAAHWQYFPTPSISMEATHAERKDISYRGDARVTTARLNQPLWTGGRLSAGVDKANAGVLASQASLEATRWDLTLKIVQTYADLLSAHYKIIANSKSLDAHNELREKIERRIAQGVSPRVDLTLVMGRTEQVNADLSIAKSQQEAAVARLAQLVGRPLQAQELTQGRNSAIAIDQNLQLLLERAQAGNPNVARLAAAARVAEAEISERKADMKPEVYVRAERQMGNFSYTGMPAVNRVFLGMSTRFGAGLSTLSQVGGAQARYESALEDIEGARMALAEQVSSDYLLAASGQSRLVLLESSLSSAQAISQAWDRQFLAGQKSWLDVMNAVRELAGVELQIADVKASTVLLTWRLALYTQGVDALITQGRAQIPVANSEPRAVKKLRLSSSVAATATGTGTGTGTGTARKAFAAAPSLAPVVQGGAIALRMDKVLHSLVSSRSDVGSPPIQVAEKSVGSW